MKNTSEKKWVPFGYTPSNNSFWQRIQEANQTTVLLTATVLIFLFVVLRFILPLLQKGAA
jgi:hypothetical protein